MKDFVHALRKLFPVGLALLTTGLISLAQTAQVQWESSSASFDESAGTVNLTLVKSGTTLSTTTINYSTVQLASSATSGLDYFSVISSPVVIPPSEGNQTFEVQITINQDFLEEPSESFLVSLSTFDPSLTIGANKDITITIIDDDGSTGGGGVVVEWAESVVRVNEDAVTVELTAVRTGGLTSAVSVTYETFIDQGSEISTLDFQTKTGSISFPAGITQQSVSININNDSLVEPEEEFKVRLKNVSSGTIGTKNPIRVIIEDDESNAGVIGWSVASVQVSEGDAEVDLQVERVGGSQGSISVGYQSKSGSAIAGSDFTLIPGTLTWIHGSNTPRTITVQIIDDENLEGPESFELELSSVGGGVELGQQTVTVTIEDNDDASSAGVASFVEPSVNVDESIGTVSVSVARSGGSAGMLTVGYSFADSDATNGADYTGVDGELTWLDGDTANKIIQVPIIDDSSADSGEIFYVTLSAEDVSHLGDLTTFTVVLEDNDIFTPGTITFATNSSSVLESAGQVPVIVQRIGGSTGQVSVNYETVNGSALETVDYLIAWGTLTWPDGDSANKEILVSLVNDEFFEGNETLSLTLSDVAGGNVAGANSIHTITIQDDEPEPATWFEFKRILFSGTEGAAQIQIEVERFGAGVGEASVFVRSENITAEVWSDYVLLDEKLTWLDGETGVKTASLSVIDDGNSEASELVRVYLDEASENALVGDVSSASALIYDDDSASGDLVNLSTRGYVGTGDEVLIGGFIIRGGSQQLLIRAIGPSLAGVDGVVQDPALQIVDNSNQELIYENDNWIDDIDQIVPIRDTGLGEMNSFESALLIELPEGSYSALVSANTDPGIGSIEIYIDSSAGLPGNLLNISTRGRVSSGDEILIGGLIIRGSAPKRILIRGVGPSLIIPSAPSLTNPELLLFDETGQEVMRNDDWLNESNWDEIEATLLAPMDVEAAMLFEVSPGAYTIHLRSEADETGIGLVEIYSLN